MTKITKLKKPTKVLHVKRSPLSDVERFIWWKKMYMMTFSIVISLLIVPIFAWKNGNIVLGIRISILFYLFIMLIFFMIQKKTTKPDELYLSNKGYLPPAPTKAWWKTPLKVLFILLRVYILYLLYTVWIMTFG